MLACGQFLYIETLPNGSDLKLEVAVPRVKLFVEFTDDSNDDMVIFKHDFFLNLYLSGALQVSNSQDFGVFLI